MITVKYNIDFGKALKVVGEQSLERYVNAHFADRTAKLARDYIADGKVKPKLSKNNPRGTKARPLFDTGKLAYSLKGSTSGISAEKYGKYHRQEGGFKAWGKFDVPQREFIPHYKESAKGRAVVALRGTKSDVKKIYEDFKKKFIRLLNKRIRKK
tara:strand:- start:59 stop:523 length:465 start_codon:yes stop_codon:yes gene_type:complete